jgi:thiol:disulfide interchange protein
VIPVSLEWLIFIYLGVMLGLVFGAWIVSEWRRQRRERRAFRHVLRCLLCAFEFEDTTATVLPRCPRCGSLNERYPLSRL